MRRFRPLRTATAVLVVMVPAVSLAACGGDSDSGSGSGTTVDVPASKFESQTGKRSVGIDAADNTFEASYVTVSTGTKVTWENVGRNAHNVVPVNKDEFTGVTTSDFGPGQVYSETFDHPGDYPYYCSLHGTKNLNGMSGVIRVVAK
jgi:plastocyanin